MPLMSIFDIAGSGMSAQSVRLNTVASNLANAESVSSTPEGAYHARQPVFSSVLNSVSGDGQDVAVKVSDVVESNDPIPRRYAPDNPLADENGYIYLSNVNPIEEMANMISASRAYQGNVEVMNTSKNLLLKTLGLGQ